MRQNRSPLPSSLLSLPEKTAPLPGSEETPPTAAAAAARFSAMADPMPSPLLAAAHVALPHHARSPSTPTFSPTASSPGTPTTQQLRKEKGSRESSAVQDPGLRDYRLGECLGKGAFGSVYKAFNWGTGEAVAVKQIKLANLPKSELRMIESEIDLLKNLHLTKQHDNIVKYIGFVKTAECLNIILEYCENGSLHSICKTYGKFPENLVGVYMTQVLQGLQYLHDQGVIHRDIKGANILTTKDGTVKLADFGVSTSTLTGGGPDKEAQVVGTPYWMAPEIIQLSGASSASDIWSVGCTVIELLQGRPPYHHLAAMPALFAIVNDDHPPLLEGISNAARDFLMQCFQKDPNLRVSARKLLRHAWLAGCRKNEPQIAKKAPSNFSQAVEEVKQWNKALKSSETVLRASTGPGPPDSHGTHSHGTHSHETPPVGYPPNRTNFSAITAKGPLSLPKPRVAATTEAFRSPEMTDEDNWDNDFATVSLSAHALRLPHLKPQDNFGGLLSNDRLKQFASLDGSSPPSVEPMSAPDHLPDATFPLPQQKPNPQIQQGQGQGRQFPRLPLRGYEEAYHGPLDDQNHVQGQNQLGQSLKGQNQLGQNQLGQNQLGQNQLGQNQLGQNQLGQNQLGQSLEGGDMFTSPSSSLEIDTQETIRPFSPTHRQRRSSPFALSIAAPSTPAHLDSIASTLANAKTASTVPESTNPPQADARASPESFTPQHLTTTSSFPSTATTSSSSFPSAATTSPDPLRLVPRLITSPKPFSLAAHDMTKSPQRSNFGDKFDGPPRLDRSYQEQPVEDYSDLFEEDTDLSKGFHLVLRKRHQTNSPQLFHPSDLTSHPSRSQTSTGSTTGRGSGGVGMGSTGMANGGIRRGRSETNTSDVPLRRARSSIEIQKFAEDEEEDFSDIFGLEGSSPGGRGDSDTESEDGGRMVLSKMSNHSWLGDDEEEDDPFASMDQEGWDEMDLEANIARDRHARLCERVEELVRCLKTTEGEDVLCDVSEDLLYLLWENEEVKNLIITAHGLLPILEILEPCTAQSRQSMILQLLRIVNTIICNDVEIQENLCFVGGIPIITKFAARQYSNEIRLEAAAFVRQMYQTSTLTLQMFVSAGGLNVLVDFLDEDYDTARDLVLIGVNGIWNVFDLQGPTPKNDFCRIFSRSRILDPLALVLHRVLDEEKMMKGGDADDEAKDEVSELMEGRIVGIFYLFSQAENYVKEVVADRQVLKSVLRDLRRMTPQHQITMLKFIKNLSMLSTTLETLHSADAIDFLIDLLGFSMKRGHPHLREVSNQVLNTMFNLCRLSKERQEDAAVGGMIPLLMRIMKTERPPKEFVLPILCDMAHSGQKGRRYLWQNGGLDFYISLLADQYWQVTALDAIHVWLQEETAKVEAYLRDRGFATAILSCFGWRRLTTFDANLLEPLAKMVRLSPMLSSLLAVADMYEGISQRLNHKKAVVRLNLLRLLRCLMDVMNGGVPTTAALTPSSNGSVSKEWNELMDHVQQLAEKDTAVLVRNLAAEIVKLNGEIIRQTLTTATTGTSSSSTSSSTSPSSSSLTPTSASSMSLISPGFRESHSGHGHSGHGHGSHGSDFHPGMNASSLGISSRRAAAGLRRTNSFTPGHGHHHGHSEASLLGLGPGQHGLNHSHGHGHGHGHNHSHSSNPPTPTAPHVRLRASQLSLSGSTSPSIYSDMLSSPRRSTLSGGRESLLSFRPGSRDGLSPSYLRRVSGDTGGGVGNGSSGSGSFGTYESRDVRNGGNMSRGSGGSGMSTLSSTSTSSASTVAGSSSHTPSSLSFSTSTQNLGRPATPSTLTAPQHAYSASASNLSLSSRSHSIGENEPKSYLVYGRGPESMTTTHDSSSTHSGMSSTAATRSSTHLPTNTPGGKSRLTRNASSFQRYDSGISMASSSSSSTPTATSTPTGVASSVPMSPMSSLTNAMSSSSPVRRDSMALREGSERPCREGPSHSASASLSSATPVSGTNSTSYSGRIPGQRYLYRNHSVYRGQKGSLQVGGSSGSNSGSGSSRNASNGSTSSTTSTSSSLSLDSYSHETDMGSRDAGNARGPKDLGDVMSSLSLSESAPSLAAYPEADDDGRDPFDFPNPFGRHATGKDMVGGEDEDMATTATPPPVERRERKLGLARRLSRRTDRSS